MIIVFTILLLSCIIHPPTRLKNSNGVSKARVGRFKMVM